jgi:hypothetical protein
MSDTKRSNGFNRRSVRVVLAFFGAILVGVISNAIWDVVAKPGLNNLSSAALRLIGLLSTTVADLPYSTAALNPYALPSLIILLLIVASIPGFGIQPLVRPLVEWRLDRYVTPSSDALVTSSETVESEQAARSAALKVSKILKVASLVLALFCLFVFMVSYVTFGIVNRAIAIRRIYEANLDIIAPYVSSQERLQLQAQFAAMTIKRDYIAIRLRLETIASKNAVKLRPETTE